MTPTNIPRAAQRGPARVASDPTGGGRRSGSSAFLTILLVLFLLSIYVEVPLYVTDSFFVPSVFSVVVLTPVLGVLYLRRTYRYEAAFVGSLVLLFSLSALLSPGWELMDQKLLGAAQTMISVVGGILLLKLLEDLQKPRVTRVLAVFWVALVVGAFLEVAGVLSGPSDAFREVAFAESGYGVYEADERDSEITGFARPKLFTSEPSLLAIGFFAFANSWLVLSYSKKRLLVVCLATALMLGLVGSPVLLLSFIVSLMVALYSEKGAASSLLVGAVACIVGLAVIFAQPDLVSSLVSRIGESLQYAGTLKLSSENKRIIFPFITVVDVLQNSPLFGTGISGKEVIERYSRLPIDTLYAFGNNALAHLLIYLGIVGSPLFAWIVLRYWRQAGVTQVALLAVLVIALTQMMGGPEAPRFWGYVFLFTGAVKMSTRPSGPMESTAARRRPVERGWPAGDAGSAEAARGRASRGPLDHHDGGGCR